MATDNEIIQVITKLNRLTQEGKIKWNRKDPPSSLIAGTNTKIFDFYAANYKGKNIGLFEERYQAYDEDFFHGEYWTSRFVLAFFSSDWEKEWEFPKNTGIYELLDSIKYQVAEVEDFMNDLLKGNDTE